MIAGVNYYSIKITNGGISNLKNFKCNSAVSMNCNGVKYSVKSNAKFCMNSFLYKKTLISKLVSNVQHYIISSSS